MADAERELLMLLGIRAVAMGGMVALVAGTAACGPGSGSSSGGSGGPAAGGSVKDVHVVKAAYTASTNQMTAAFRFNEIVQAKSSTGSSQNGTVTGSGQADFASRSFKVNSSSPGGSITILQTSGTEYTQVPAAERNQTPGHKAWVSVNLTRVSQAELSAWLSQLSSVSSNPAQALSQLTFVSGPVTAAGTATISGVPTTVYRAEENLDKAAAGAPAKTAQAIRQEAKELGTSTPPVQIWIDAHHLVRQIRYETPGPAASNGIATTTVTFPRYGVPVSFTPPPAGQTADITSQLLQQAAASSG
jgi:hypothetical protein